MKRSSITHEEEEEFKNHIKNVMMDKGYRNLFQINGYPYFSELRPYDDIDYEYIRNKPLVKILNTIKRDDSDFIFIHNYFRISNRRIREGNPAKFYLSAHGIINYEKKNNLNIFTPIIVEITKFLMMSSDKEVSEIEIRHHLKSKNISMHLFDIKTLLISYRSLMYDYIDKLSTWFCETKNDEKPSFFSKAGENFIKEYIT